MAVQGVALINAAGISASVAISVAPKPVSGTATVQRVVAKGEWWPTEEEMAIMLNVMEGA